MSALPSVVDNDRRLLRITGAIADAVSSAEVYEALVDHVAEALGASSAGLWLVDDDAKTVRLARGRGYSDTARKHLEVLAADLTPGLPILDAIRTREPIWIPTQSELLVRYPHLQGVATIGRAYRVSVLPLVVHGRSLGALGLTIEGVEQPNDDERDFLMLVARYAGQAIERLRAADRSSRLYQETIDARVRAEQLYRFAQAVVGAERIEDIFDASLTAIELALGAKRSAILTYGNDEIMRFRAWRNLSDGYRAAVEGHSPWPRDVVAPEPVLVPDAHGDPALASYRPLFQSEGIGALGFIPLMNDGRLLGKFMLYYEDAHSFVPHELETAGAIANHLASVISKFAAVARLKDTVRYNELFAGVLAHDLRNPLAAMIMSAQVVLAQRQGERYDSTPLSRILSSGKRMAVMIDQLLDLTRARSGGGIDILPSSTNLEELCTQAIDELELTYPSWKIRRQVTGDQRGSWDAARLLQVVSNLLANAGQHGAAGGLISLMLDGSAREHVSLAVHNEGVIPESLLPHLFDPFRRIEKRGGHARGLGLGLFIVREIVGAHGGSVRVDSAEATGTRFSIQLPRRLAQIE